MSDTAQVLLAIAQVITALGVMIGTVLSALNRRNLGEVKKELEENPAKCAAEVVKVNSICGYKPPKMPGE